MSVRLGPTHPGLSIARSLVTGFLLLWFVTGQPLALYAESLDDFDGVGGAEQMTRRNGADSLGPLPDPGQGPDDDGRRLRALPTTAGTLNEVATLAQTLRFRSTAIVKRLSTPQRQPLPLPLQIAPLSCRDDEPPHAP